jgi:sulfur-oxidizing protein SoxX
MPKWLVSDSTGGLALIVIGTLFTMPALSADKEKTPIAAGQTLAIEQCQACHQFKGADQAGTLGPAFISMSERFPKRERLQEIIYDAQKAINPYSMMPPFGRHGLLNKNETEQLIDFLYTL